MPEVQTDTGPAEAGGDEDTVAEQYPMLCNIAEHVRQTLGRDIKDHSGDIITGDSDVHHYVDNVIRRDADVILVIDHPDTNYSPSAIIRAAMDGETVAVSVEYGESYGHDTVYLTSEDWLLDSLRDLLDTGWHIKGADEQSRLYRELIDVINSQKND